MLLRTGCCLRAVFVTMSNLFFVVSLVGSSRTEPALVTSFGQASSCPFGRRMSSAELLHSATLGSYNDSLERQMFESADVRRLVSRQQRNEEGFLYGVRSYLRHCVKPVLSCGTIYRSYNGICNNLVNTKWGSANSCLLRILPAHYRDGIAAPVSERVGLPSASSVSRALRNIRTGSTPVATTELLFAFGQFLDHDLANSVISSITTSNNPNGDCCFAPSHPQCSMALNVTEDPFYRRHNVNCINFVRAARCPCSSTRERQQMNGATAYIDLSQIYGNDGLEADFLRNRQKRYLLDTSGDGVLLPLGGKHCVSQECFRGADNRINQQSALTALHTIFVRHHNNIAERLRTLNPRWRNDRVFEETRRINIAQFQVVVLKEFLPVLLGETLLRKKGISFDHVLRGTHYDDSLEAGMFNEFLTAGFRLHTMIPETLANDLKFKFFNVDDFFREGSDHCTRVLESLTSSEGKAARFPVSDITTHHVYDTDGDFGLDLVAINVQRGRDHGLRPYIDYLAHLRNLNIDKFNDLHQVMTNDSVKTLQRLYRRVDDIDLYVGGYLEEQRYGVLSETMADIVVNQFEHLIKADRFFVTHGSYFTNAQLQNILNTSLSNILCSTTDLTKVPRLPLREFSNYVSCAQVDALNTEYWSDV